MYFSTTKYEQFLRCYCQLVTPICMRHTVCQSGIIPVVWLTAASMLLVGVGDAMYVRDMLEMSEQPIWTFFVTNIFYIDYQLSSANTTY